MAIAGDITTLLETAAWLVALVALAAPFTYASDDDPAKWLGRANSRRRRGPPASPS